MVESAGPGVGLKWEWSLCNDMATWSDRDVVTQSTGGCGGSNIPRSVEAGRISAIIEADTEGSV